MSRKRALLAIVLAVVHPGLGHTVTREWWRALLWAGLFVSAVVVLFPEPSTSGSVFESSRRMVQDASVEASVAVSLIVVASAVDAGLLATRYGDDAAAVAEGTCPSCGEELDEDLDFCPWCTTRLEESEGE